jgi:hypothetical protein
MKILEQVRAVVEKLGDESLANQVVAEFTKMLSYENG